MTALFVVGGTVLGAVVLAGGVSLILSFIEGTTRFFPISGPYVIEHDSECRFYRVYKQTWKFLYCYEVSHSNMDDAVSYVKKKTQRPERKKTMYNYDTIIALAALNELSGR